MRKTVGFLAAVAALMLCVGVATATAGGGKSVSVLLCVKNGWQTVVRSDASHFVSEEDCVSYAAHGGTPTPETASQVQCESVGATFSRNPATDLLGFTGGNLRFVWSCNGYPVYDVFGRDLIPLDNDCTADTAPSFHDLPSLGLFPGIVDLTCYRVVQ
jgi:hypothetical protein